MDSREYVSNQKWVYTREKESVYIEYVIILSSCTTLTYTYRATFKYVNSINYQYYKVIRVFVCVSVCVCLHNSGTAGPIWLNLFLLAPSWSRDGFRPKKFRIRDPVFPEIRQKSVFLRYYLTNLAEIFRIYSS